MIHHNLRSALFSLTLLAAVAANVNPARAVIFDFDISFDGTDATVDLTSESIIGSSFDPGDGFNLDIHADGDDFWQAISSVNSIIGASFQVSPSGTRTGDVTTTFFLDGVQTGQIVETNINQTSVHIGNQTFDINAGLTFDQVVIDYVLLASTAPTTTILPVADILGFNPFFRNANIAYVQAPTAVDEPAAIAFLGLGLAAIGISHRRRRQRSA